jgi:hypothetical protein
MKSYDLERAKPEQATIKLQVDHDMKQEIQNKIIYFAYQIN